MDKGERTNNDQIDLDNTNQMLYRNLYQLPPKNGNYIILYFRYRNFKKKNI